MSCQLTRRATGDRRLGVDYLTVVAEFNQAQYGLVRAVGGSAGPGEAATTQPTRAP